MPEQHQYYDDELDRIPWETDDPWPLKEGLIWYNLREKAIKYYNGVSVVKLSGNLSDVEIDDDKDWQFHWVYNIGVGSLDILPMEDRKYNIGSYDYSSPPYLLRYESLASYHAHHHSLIMESEPPDDPVYGYMPELQHRWTHGWVDCSSTYFVGGHYAVTGMIAPYGGAYNASLGITDSSYSPSNDIRPFDMGYIKRGWFKSITFSSDPGAYSLPDDTYIQIDSDYSIIGGSNISISGVYNLGNSSLGLPCQMVFNDDSNNLLVLPKGTFVAGVYPDRAIFVRGNCRLSYVMNGEERSPPAYVFCRSVFLAFPDYEVSYIYLPFNAKFIRVTLSTSSNRGHVDAHWHGSHAHTYQHATEGGASPYTSGLVSDTTSYEDVGWGNAIPSSHGNTPSGAYVYIGGYSFGPGQTEASVNISSGSQIVRIGCTGGLGWIHVILEFW